jgi:hypothetical protein
MFDESESALLEQVFRAVLDQLGPLVIEANPDRAVMAALYQPVLDEWERLTGERETQGGHFMHHRLANFGPPCPKCGKLLRTQRASKCMECGTPRSI